MGDRKRKANRDNGSAEPKSRKKRGTGKAIAGAAKAAVAKAEEAIGKKTKARSEKKASKRSRVVLLVATKKGAWIFRGDRKRKKWDADGPHFLGHVIHHVVLDPRDGRTLLAAAKTGHLGPTIFRSQDFGKSWQEAGKPPAFPKAREAEKGRVVDHTFWLTPGHESEPGVWYAGTSPHGLFKTEDGGDTWQPIAGLNDNPAYRTWMGGPQDGTPDGPKMHSVIVDPRDASHLYLGMSSGGVHESLDGGKTWKPLIAGLEVVEQLDPSNVQFHDPHCVVICPSNPDRLYQQNHCGIYRIDRPSDEWVRVGKNMPEKVGDVGFPMVVHPRDDETAWVFPMDGTSVWPRTSPDGKPSAFVTRNGGKKWERLDRGMPKRAWWTVKRQAMAADLHDPVGLYFGTTSGEVWVSRDEGKRWSCIAEHLPEIYAVETGAVAR